MEEGCGLDVVNDGELRRFSFLDHLLGDMEGVADMPGAPVHFHVPIPPRTGICTPRSPAPTPALDPGRGR